MTDAEIVGIPRFRVLASDGRMGPFAGILRTVCGLARTDRGHRTAPTVAAVGAV